MAALGSDLRSEMAASEAGLRAEMAASEAGLRAEVGSVQAAVAAQAGQIAALGAELHAVEARLDSTFHKGLRTQLVTVLSSQFAFTSLLYALLR
jgi:F0F1-type ATP synthase membrane subunit b/b'